MSILEVKNLTKNFGGLAAVSDVNLHLDENELVGLIGPNGAGKTTLFNLLTGVYVPSEGEITLAKAKKLNALATYKIADLGLARTFQNIRLFTELTVLENVLVAMDSKNHESFLASVLRLPSFYKQEQMLRKKALNLLDIFALADKAETLSRNLSYGEQRCLEIVRALARSPKVLFLDEPAAGMNPQETAELTVLIKKIKEDFKLMIVLIEHDMNLVMEVCERIYVLEYGQMIAEGTPSEIKSNKRVIEAYLGSEV
ncbi:MAG: ABC transporter ATP-binding protein [Streptococcaceae bacterium]|jgi:branched-chain amino acid transport system ATP-binding protein|nr:ABC transporter ATP-binding protein [Streptococcaceae bacterium]